MDDTKISSAQNVDSKSCVYVQETERSMTLGSQSELDSQIITHTFSLHTKQAADKKKKILYWKLN